MISNLAWQELDPARHPFDSASALQVVFSLPPARQVPSRPDIPANDPAMNRWEWDVGHPWEEAMSRALVERYGRWALGWRWAHPYGGPIRNWSSAGSSIGTPENTPARVAAALCEWREWLQSLAGWFEAYPLETGAGIDQPVLWRRAARDLIVHVVERTESYDAWYAQCTLVLTWFLERWNVAPDVAKGLVDGAIGGRFKSYTQPDPVLVEDVAEQLACALPQVFGANLPDHLQRWLVAREEVPWPAARLRGAWARSKPSSDDIEKYIRAFDGAIDPARAERLLAAVQMMRGDAARGAALDFELLRDWQQDVLGLPRPPFRTLPAFAKGGRERYGIDSDTRDRLDDCLAQSTADAGNPVPLAARAARAYLDVCFFHPFDDGNARSALLALLFVLAREGIVLHGVRLLRRATFYADDPQDALWLARMIETHIANAQRERCG